ncbi:hypothetical protein [Actinosynnema pretiosum]|uniref:hypothetical protein n=1 Tax=Actinosynnema pretiosum TaxID=42197 RepID=UPI0012FE5402|nr:hypothetical protein [Actinosynnema pretiosum]
MAKSLERTLRDRTPGGLVDPTDPGRLPVRLPRESAVRALVERFTASRFLVVRGEPGVGKSALALSAVDEARACGGEVVLLSLADLPDRPLDVPAVLGCALDDLLELPASPVRLLVVDGAEDVQRGKADTLVALTRAAHRARLGVVALCRDDAAPDVLLHLRGVAGDLAGSPVDEHVVAPLGADEVDDLVTAFPRLRPLAGAQGTAIRLVQRPGLVRMVLAGLGSGQSSADLSEADVFLAVWQRWVRCGEVLAAGKATPDGRHRALLALAESEVTGVRPDGVNDPLALPSLRSDGLLLPRRNGFLVRGQDEFADDTVRDFAVAMWLMSEGFDVSSLPRWCVRAAKLACQATLEAVAPRGRAEAGQELFRFRELFDRLAWDEGEVWDGLLWEAVVTSGRAGLLLSAATRRLLHDADGLRQLLSVVEQRFSTEDTVDFVVGEGVVGFLLERWHAAPEPVAEVRREADALLLRWLRASAQRQGLLERHHELQTGIGAALLARTGHVDDETLVEGLALLGERMGDAGRARLRSIADDHPQHLHPCLERAPASRVLAGYDVELLAELTEAYYVVGRSRRRSGRGASWGPLVRDHRRPWFGPPWAHAALGPFNVLLFRSPRLGLVVVNRVLSRTSTAKSGLTLSVPGVGERFYRGDQVDWCRYRGRGNAHPCSSALMAVERFADHLIADGAPLATVVRVLLAPASTLAEVGLVVGLLCRHSHLVVDELDPFLDRPEVWDYENVRRTHELTSTSEEDEKARALRRRRFDKVVCALVMAALERDDRERLGRFAELSERLASHDARRPGGLAINAARAGYLNPDRWQRWREDGRYGWEYTPTPEVCEAQSPLKDYLDRRNATLGLWNRHVLRAGPPWGLVLPEPPDAESLVSDIATARDLAAGSEAVEDQQTGEAVAATAATAIRVAKPVEVGRADLAWATSTLMRAATLLPEQPGSRYCFSPDHSAATALPLLLLGDEAESAESGLLTLARSTSPGVRTTLAEAFGRIWDASCQGDPCVHARAWSVVETGFGGQVCYPLLIAACAAARSKACVAPRAASTRDTTLRAIADRANCGEAGDWYEEAHERGPASGAVLDASPPDDPSLLLRHAALLDAEPLTDLLHDLTRLATYRVDHRRSYTAAWPALAEIVLSGQRDPVKRPSQVDSLAEAFLPVPRVWEGDSQPAPLEGWPELSTVEPFMSRWLPMAVDQGGAVEKLVRLLRRSSPERQADVGLPWVRQLLVPARRITARAAADVAGWLRLLCEADVLDAVNRADHLDCVDALTRAGFGDLCEGLVLE